MTLPILALVFFPRAAWACPDVDSTLNAAVQDILAADASGTAGDFASMDDALGCQHVTRQQVARYLLIRGGAAELGSPGDGELLLASARALDPSVWEPQLGPELKATWARQRADATGSLILDTNADGGWVDGERVASWPAVVFAGWHVVQVVTTDGATVMFGKAVNLPAGGNSLVATGLPESGAMAGIRTEPPGEVRKHRVISPAWLVASLVTAAAGGGLAVGARLQSDRFSQYESVEAVDQAWLRERELAYGAYIAFGAAGVLGVLSFTLP